MSFYFFPDLFQFLSVVFLGFSDLFLASAGGDSGTRAGVAAWYVQDWQTWISAFFSVFVLVDLLVLFACAGLAWFVTWIFLRRRDVSVSASGASFDVRRSVLLGERGFDGVLFPFLWWAFVVFCRSGFLSGHVAPVLQIAIPALLALFSIRTGVMVLRAAFPDLVVARVLERSISWFAWGAFVLWITGVLPASLHFLDSLTWQAGSYRLSVRTLLEGVLTAGALLILAMWVSSNIEQWLLKSAEGTGLSVRKAIANVTRAFMLFIGLLVGLSAVGIDLTALSVLSGAVGVGIGFGLQKLAASYVSGFVVLAERSVRIGDVVRVGGFEGVVRDIRPRYTLIRALGGVEAIVPNETMMTATVENLTLADSRVSQSTMVSVDYGADVELVRSILLEAALGVPRILKDPSPSVLLSNFGADGLDFTVNYWLGDPQNGLGGVRSQLNVAILLALRANNIDIPFPQRVVHNINSGK